MKDYIFIKGAKEHNLNEAMTYGARRATQVIRPNLSRAKRGISFREIKL